MRILVTGSREWSDPEAIRDALEMHTRHIEDPSTVTVIQGGARGADSMARQLARELGFNVETHEADWNQGRQAGYARNATMVASGADLCLAFILDGSRGASMCAQLAQKKNIPTYVWEYSTHA